MPIISKYNMQTIMSITGNDTLLPSATVSQAMHLILTLGGALVYTVNDSTNLFTFLDVFIWKFNWQI